MTEVLLIYNKSSKFEYFRKFLGKMKLKDQFAYIFNCFISKIVIEERSSVQYSLCKWLQ